MEFIKHCCPKWVCQKLSLLFIFESEKWFCQNLLFFLLASTLFGVGVGVGVGVDMTARVHCTWERGWDTGVDEKKIEQRGREKKLWFQIFVPTGLPNTRTPWLARKFCQKVFWCIYFNRKCVWLLFDQMNLTFSWFDEVGCYKVG